jgi:cytochrome P450
MVVQQGVPSHVPADCVVDIDIYAMPGGDKDLHASWLSLQRLTDRDFLWTARNGGHWIALRGPHVKQIWLDAARFSNHGVYIPKSEARQFGLAPQQLDAPDHTEYKRAVMKGMAAKHFMAMEEPARTLSATLIESVRSRGKCEFLTEVAEPLPIQLFLAFAGLPIEDWKRLRPLGSQVVRKDTGLTEADMMAFANAYLEPVVRQAMDSPGDSPFGRMFAEPIFGRPMPFAGAMAVARGVLFAGLDTVSANLGFIVYHLARFPEHRRALMANAGLIGGAIDELLRRYTTIAAGRELVEDVEMGGIRLKKGDVVCAPFVLHNLDPSLFPDPLQVRLDRGGLDQLTFGAGIHRCPASSLARIELMTFTKEMLARIPDFELDPDHPIRMKTGIVGALGDLHLRWPVR